MRRIAGSLVLAIALAALVTTGFGGESGPPGTYELEVDNAFGLEERGDVRVVGAEAGEITGVELDFRTRRAVVSFRIDRDDFGSLRSDARCEVRLQSLIGDYYLDCWPGASPRRLEPGARIPVERSAGTVPADLIQDIQRRPYRERLSIFINELGAAAAGNGRNLNAAIRRLVPALRVTDEVLRTLADERRVIARLATNANQVVSALARNRRDVGRWVAETRDTTSAAAARRRALARGWEKLPGFLRELTPSMGALRSVARESTPALVELSEAADQTRGFLDQLGKFSDAGLPALRALGTASDVGGPAMRRARPLVRELGRFAGPAPDVASNLALVLEHLDDREHAIEEDPWSPGGNGFTGFEAFLQTFYNVTLRGNGYSDDGHFGRTVLLSRPDCEQYADPERAREVYDECASVLGPTQPGVTTPDPTASGGRARERRSARAGRGERNASREPGQGPSAPDGRAPAGVPGSIPLLPLPDLPLAGGGEAPPPTDALLDYLLGP